MDKGSDNKRLVRDEEKAGKKAGTAAAAGVATEKVTSTIKK